MGTVTCIIFIGRSHTFHSGILYPPIKVIYLHENDVPYFFWPEERGVRYVPEGPKGFCWALTDLILIHVPKLLDSYQMIREIDDQMYKEHGIRLRDYILKEKKRRDDEKYRLLQKARRYVEHGSMQEDTQIHIIFLDGISHDAAIGLAFNAQRLRPKPFIYDIIEEEEFIKKFGKAIFKMLQEFFIEEYF